MKAKDILIAPISSKDANAFVRKNHYSGKVVPNSQLHFRAFVNKVLLGVMSFGCPMDKRKSLLLVKDTKWNGMLELNRMVFHDILPKNSESRAISIAIKLIKKNYPHIEWILSFADGCQCGDGTIYRASGFYLTGIKTNTGQRIDEKTKEVFSQITFSAHRPGQKDYWQTLKKLEGFQLRYVYFMNESAKSRLTVSILPFSAIEKHKAGMYKGIKRVSNSDSAVSDIQSEKGGATPTDTLHFKAISL